ncbi:MAG: hypothetical protein IPK76_06520 [Lewinellaceae bacterium]|jgi:hypothetical protein|nr:hypothetical protein [Lewinellaceae bacterium]
MAIIANVFRRVAAIMLWNVPNYLIYYFTDNQTLLMKIICQSSKRQWALSIFAGTLTLMKGNAI